MLKHYVVAEKGFGALCPLLLSCCCLLQEESQPLSRLQHLMACHPNARHTRIVADAEATKIDDLTATIEECTVSSAHLNIQIKNFQASTTQPFKQGKFVKPEQSNVIILPEDTLKQLEKEPEDEETYKQQCLE